MNIELRRKKIIDLLSAHGSIEVKNHAQELNTSLVTVRSDLSNLEKEGKLQRFFGGAKLPSSTGEVQHQSRNQEIEVNMRHQMNDIAKERIAKRAASLVKEYSSIIIDSGSTTHKLSLELAKKGNLTVITNNLTAASSLIDISTVTLVICGGVYRTVSQSIHGQKAEQFFDGIYADIAFIGADGLDPSKGITTFNEGYNITQKMVECAKSIVVLADSSKLSRSGFNQVLPTEKLQTLIIDSGVSDDVVEEFEAKGIEVIVV